MPRTKVKKPTKAKEHVKHKNMVLLDLKRKLSEVLEEYENLKQQQLKEYKVFASETNALIPVKYKNMTLGELKNLPSDKNSTTVTCMSKEELVNITKTVKKKKNTLKRSSSCADDEGGRKSRSRARAGAKKSVSRITRSLSRTHLRNPPLTCKTPSNSIPPNSYGTVTPKCNPNTPQVLLRRPKLGELALSLQGSPLYTATVVSETKPNINIPLMDGRLLTLQPQRGLRMSQIPEMDSEMLHQLETLRDNLSKMCATSEIKKCS